MSNLQGFFFWLLPRKTRKGRPESFDLKENFLIAWQKSIRNRINSINPCWIFSSYSAESFKNPRLNTLSTRVRFLFHLSNDWLLTETNNINLSNVTIAVTWYISPSAVRSHELYLDGNTSNLVSRRVAFSDSLCIYI